MKRESEIARKIESLDERVKKIIVTDSDVMKELLKNPLDRIIRNVQDTKEINRKISHMLQGYYEDGETKYFGSKWENGIWLHKAKFWIGIMGLETLDTKFVADILTQRRFDMGGGGIGDHYHYADRVLIGHFLRSFLYDKMQIGEPIAVLENENLSILGEYKRNVPENWKCTVTSLKKNGIEINETYYETRNGRFFIDGKEPGTFLEIKNKGEKVK